MARPIKNLSASEAVLAFARYLDSEEFDRGVSLEVAAKWFAEANGFKAPRKGYERAVKPQ